MAESADDPLLRSRNNGRRVDHCHVQRDACNGKKRGGISYKKFFKAFAANFRQATAMWAVILAGTLVILADVHIIGNYAPQFKIWLLVPMCFIVIVLLALFLYVFPLQAYFRNTIRGTMGNALKLSVAHLPYTVVF